MGLFGAKGLILFGHFEGFFGQFWIKLISVKERGL